MTQKKNTHRNSYNEKKSKELSKALKDNIARRKEQTKNQNTDLK